MRSDQLIDIAYTTQTGRKAYDYRLAVVAQTVEEFLSRAKEWLNNEEKSLSGIYSGCVKDANSKLMTGLFNDNQGQSITDSLLDARVVEKLATIWVCGGLVDWKRYYSAPNSEINKPQRVSLPGYPFERVDTSIHRSSALNKTRDNRTSHVVADKQVSIPNETSNFNYQPGVWYQIDRSEINVSELIDSCADESVKALFANGKDWKHTYWETHCENDFSGGSEKSKKQRSSIKRQSINVTLSSKQVQAIQRFTQEQSIESNTLFIGAWALLISRLKSAKQVRFGCDDLSTVAGVFPLELKTVGRQNTRDWLLSLQQQRLLRYVASEHSTGNNTVKRAAKTEWDSVICIESDRTDQRQKAVSKIITSNYLNVSVTPDSITLILESVNGEMYGVCESDFSEHLLNFIDGMVSHPKRNPSMLSLLTKKEYREKFWQQLEQQEESV